MYLYKLNRDYDPRFFQFMESRPGQVLSRIIGWSDQRTPIPHHKPEPEYTPEERAVKTRLEDQFRRAAVTDIVVKSDGERLAGRMIEATPAAVILEQVFGESGKINLTIPRANIDRIEKANPEEIQVNYRDVRFQMEFPELNLYRRPPYTILTSQHFFAVEDAARLLASLHQDVCETFAPLFVGDGQGDGIQLLFFHDEASFEIYRRKHAPRMKDSAGFYSAALDRFVIFDQKNSTQFKDTRSQLDAVKEQYEVQGRDPAYRQAVQRWHRKQSKQLIRSGNRETERTIRHEGAHQLFYTYGVHSKYHLENLWLLEGLATYCENRYLGQQPEYYVAHLKQSAPLGHLPAFSKLVNFRSGKGFVGLVRADDQGLAYAQSWFLVAYLMKKPHRDAFFDYIRYVREVSHRPSLIDTPRVEVLCRFLGLEVTEFDEQLATEVSRL